MSAEITVSPKINSYARNRRIDREGRERPLVTIPVDEKGDPAGLKGFSKEEVEEIRGGGIIDYHELLLERFKRIPKVGRRGFINFYSDVFGVGRWRPVTDSEKLDAALYFTFLLFGVLGLALIPASFLPAIFFAMLLAFAVFNTYLEMQLATLSELHTLSSLELERLTREREEIFEKTRSMMDETLKALTQSKAPES